MSLKTWKTEYYKLSAFLFIKELTQGTRPLATTLSKAGVSNYFAKLNKKYGEEVIEKVYRDLVEERLSSTENCLAKDPIISFASVAHSYKKWLGVLDKPLKAHKLDAETVLEDLPMGYVTCSLCEFSNKAEDEPPCDYCPLYKVTNKTRCDDEDGPYIEFRSTSNPAKMIKALENTLKQYEEKLNEYLSKKIKKLSNKTKQKGKTKSVSEKKLRSKSRV